MPCQWNKLPFLSFFRILGFCLASALLPSDRTHSHERPEGGSDAATQLQIGSGIEGMQHERADMSVPKACATLSAFLEGSAFPGLHVGMCDLSQHAPRLQEL